MCHVTSIFVLLLNVENVFLKIMFIKKKVKPDFYRLLSLIPCSALLIILMFLLLFVFRKKAPEAMNIKHALPSESNQDGDLQPEQYIRTNSNVTKEEKTFNLTFYGSTKQEQDKTLAALFRDQCESKFGAVKVHNYYTCSKECHDISAVDIQGMTKDKKFQHKWLFDPSLARCPDTGIWSLCYVDGLGMFCALCQMHNTAQPQTNLKTWNDIPNVRYRTETVRTHFTKAQGVMHTMHSYAVDT